MNRLLQLLSILILLLSCETKKDLAVSVQSQNTEIDTLYIKELITEKVLVKIPLQQSLQKFNFDIESPTVGAISANQGEDSYLVILKPGEKVNLSIDSTSIKTIHDVADSLLNYLWKSNNAFIAENSSVIFNTDNPQKVVSIFDSLQMKREGIINSNKEVLSKEEIEILNHQNQARINSFLFYYGRLLKDFSPSHSFFNFIHDIDNNSIWAKTLPHNLLYKYEIQYLHDHDFIPNIDSFLSFIEAQTKNKDLAEFLKSAYLANVIQHPSYWAKHEQLFNSEALQQVLEKEKSNKYYNLIKKSSDSFFSSQKGVKAYDFIATSLDGKEIKLSDFNGKLVFIDAWASWCGPCIAHRPKVIKLAEKHKDNPNVVFLMISVDSSKDKWKGFLAKRGEKNYGHELIIENGMSTEFGDKYLVKMIPKYILIDKNGIIINSDISEPSIVVEELIAQELKTM
jgi:thiol-disulfide isomerase/thioredoxin